MKTVIISIVIVVLVCVFFIACIPSMPDPVDYERYVVKSGDTLWGIAQQSDGWNKYDGHSIIDDICERSNCTAMIHPGQVVYIPMYNS